MVRLQALFKNDDNCLLTVTGFLGQTLSTLCWVKESKTSDIEGVMKSD